MPLILFILIIFGIVFITKKHETKSEQKKEQEEIEKRKLEKQMEFKVTRFASVINRNHKNIILIDENHKIKRNEYIRCFRDNESSFLAHVLEVFFLDETPYLVCDYNSTTYVITLNNVMDNSSRIFSNQSDVSDILLATHTYALMTDELTINELKSEGIANLDEYLFTYICLKIDDDELQSNQYPYLLCRAYDNDIVYNDQKYAFYYIVSDSDSMFNFVVLRKSFNANGDTVYTAIKKDDLYYTLYDRFSKEILSNERTKQ